MNSTPVASTNLQKYESGSRILQWLIRRFHGRICEVLQPLEFGTVLDVGCGEGYLSRVLLDRFPGIRVKGVDISPAAVERARERCPEGDFEVARFEDLARWTERFDLVVCSEVLEHIDDPATGAKILAGRSGGKVLVTVPWEPWFQLANLARGKYLGRWGNHPEHIHRWSLGGFVKLLEPVVEVEQAETLFPWSLVLARPQQRS